MSHAKFRYKSNALWLNKPQLFIPDFPLEIMRCSGSLKIVVSGQRLQENFRLAIIRPWLTTSLSVSSRGEDLTCPQHPHPPCLKPVPAPYSRYNTCGMSGWLPWFVFGTTEYFMVNMTLRVPPWRNESRNSIADSEASWQHHRKEQQMNCRHVHYICFNPKLSFTSIVLVNTSWNSDFKFTPHNF